MLTKLFHWSFLGFHGVFRFVYFFQRQTEREKEKERERKKKKGVWEKRDRERFFYLLIHSPNESNSQG